MEKKTIVLFVVTVFLGGCVQNKPKRNVGKVP